MGEINTNTLLYKTDNPIIELNTSHTIDLSKAGEFPPHSRDSAAPDLLADETAEEEFQTTESASGESVLRKIEAENLEPDTLEAEEPASEDSAAPSFDNTRVPVSSSAASAPEASPAGSTAEDMISQSNYLRYLAELRKADSELALAKAESAELVRLMDSYKEHYCQYEKLIQTLVQDNNMVVNQHLDTIKTLSRKLKKTSESLDKRIDKEIERLTDSLAQSIEGNIKNSCDKELQKVSEATDVLYDYSAKVKSQYNRFERLEGFKFALFIISSISSPILLILFVLNMLGIL